MQIQSAPRCFLSSSKVLPNLIGLVACLVLAKSAAAQLKSGTYDTSVGATAQEQGDNVAGGSRVVPLSATLTFDLAALQPSLTAVIHNAVLEGGSAFGSGVLGGRPQPFELTVRSQAGSLLTDGSYNFTGDYLRDVFPSGTQYFFDWKFSSTSDGPVLWNGQSYWAGGHIWVETLSAITLVSEPSTLLLILAGAGVFGICRGSSKLQRCRRDNFEIVPEDTSVRSVLCRHAPQSVPRERSFAQQHARLPPAAVLFSMTPVADGTDKVRRYSETQPIMPKAAIKHPGPVSETLVCRLDLPAEGPASVSVYVEMSFRNAWAVPLNG